MPTLNVYLSLSKQYAHKRSHCLREIDAFFEDYDVEINVNYFKGGNYTYPGKEIGKIDVFVTYVPHLGKKVGRGVVSEYDYARTKDALCLVLSGDSFSVIKEAISRDSGNYSEHALIKPSKMVVKDTFYMNKNDDINIHKSNLLNNFLDFNIFDYRKYRMYTSIESRQKQLMLLLP